MKTSFPSLSALQRHLLSFFVFSGLMLGSCKSPLELVSSQRDRDIVIDGKNLEWDGKMVLLGSKTATIGVQHDAGFLYLCFTTTDRLLAAQMVGLGFTVWFDPEGGDNKFVGIHYPLGVQVDGRILFARMEEDLPQLIDRMLEKLPPQAEIIGPGKDEIRHFSMTQQTGISAKITREGEITVFEMRVPLEKSTERSWALTMDPTKPLGIGLETSLPLGGLRSQQQVPTRGRAQPRTGAGLPNTGQLVPQQYRLWTHVAFAVRIL